MMDSALDLDESLSLGDISAIAHCNALVREARKHGFRARVTRAGHVLAMSPCDGAIIATRSAVRLASWMGY